MASLPKLVVDVEYLTDKAYPEAESSPHPANAANSTTSPANPTSSTLADLNLPSP
jgi:hypothetical protein